MNFVECDKCKYKFEIKIKEKRFKNKKVLYFICPNCGEIYITDCQDEELKKMIYKYQRLKQQKRKQELWNEMRAYQSLLINSIDKTLLN